MEISDRIKILRKDSLNLSQEKFAEQLGMSRDMIKNIENNRLKNPDQKAPVYKLICKTFGVREEWLVRGQGEMMQSYDRSEDIARFAADLLKDEEATFKRRLVSALSKLDEAGWKALEDLINEINEENENE